MKRESESSLPENIAPPKKNIDLFTITENEDENEKDEFSQKLEIQEPKIPKITEKSEEENFLSILYELDGFKLIFFDVKEWSAYELYLKEFKNIFDAGTLKLNNKIYCAGGRNIKSNKEISNSFEIKITKDPDFSISETKLTFLYNFSLKLYKKK